jgi:hypothetical protein
MISRKNMQGPPITKPRGSCVSLTVQNASPRDSRRRPLMIAPESRTTFFRFFLLASASSATVCAAAAGLGVDAAGPPALLPHFAPEGSAIKKSTSRGTTCLGLRNYFLSKKANAFDSKHKAVFFAKKRQKNRGSTNVLISRKRL